MSGSGFSMMRVVSSMMRVDQRSPDAAIEAHLLLTGEIDEEAGRDVYAAIEMAVLDSRVTAVVLDFAQVRDLDAGGVAWILHGHHAVLSVGGRLRLEHPNGLPRRVLDITGVLDLLTHQLAAGDVAAAG